MPRTTNDRSAIYARYSSHAQDDGTSIEVQLDACRLIAGPNPMEFIDRAVTGRTMHRPAWNQMLEAAEDGEFTRLVIYRYDRIGRSAHTHAVISDLEDLGIEVISCAEGKDQLARGIHLVVGEDFSRKLSQRVSDSLIKRFEQRCWTGGPPPFGYKIEHRDNRQYLAIHEGEAEIVRTVYRLYLEESVGTKEIARRLAARNLPTRYGAAWGFTQVRGMLINSTYTGEIRFGKRKMKLNKKTGRRVAIYLDPSTHRSYTDELLRIVSDDDFARVQTKMAERSVNKGVTRAARSIRPFTGLIFCQGCGSVFYAQKSTNGGHHYYVCSCRQRSGRSACPNSVTHREDKLIGEVMDHLSFIFSDTDAIIRETMNELERQVAVNKGDAGRIKTELATLNRQMVGYAGILVDPDMSKAVKGEVQLLVERMSTDRAALQLKYDQLVDRASRGAERMLEGTRRALDEAKASLEAVARPDELHALIERFVGRSLSTPEGQLVPFSPETTVGTGLAASTHSNIAATGFEPVTLGL